MKLNLKFKGEVLSWSLNFKSKFIQFEFWSEVRGWSMEFMFEFEGGSHNSNWIVMSNFEAKVQLWLKNG